jgi:hypothetical protein
MAAPAPETSATNEDAGVTTLGVGVATGSVQNDLWVGALLTTTATHTTPTDWNDIAALKNISTGSGGGARTFSVFWRLVPASPGTTTFVWGGTTENAIATIGRISGVNLASPINGTTPAPTTGDAVGPGSAPSMTTDVNECLILRVGNVANTSIDTIPGTTFYNNRSVLSGAGSQAIGTSVLTTAGATGTAAFDWSAGRVFFLATIAIAPAAAAAAPFVYNPLAEPERGPMTPIPY